MHELDLLTRLRPEVAEPDPHTLARHRLKLLARTANPVAAQRIRRPLPRLAIGGALATAAGVTAVAVVVGLTGPSAHPLPGAIPTPGAPPESSTVVPPTTADGPIGTVPASVVLADAAAALRKEPAGQGEWAYSETVITTQDAGTHTQRREVWANVDGQTGFVRTVRDGKQEPMRKTASIRTGPPSLYNSSYDYLLTLPTDPLALRAEIYRQVQQEFDRMGPNGAKLYTVDGNVFQLFMGLNRGCLPPALRGALYQVVGTIPGVETVADAADAVGRHGIGVSLPVNKVGDRAVLVFDRTTHLPLGLQGSTHDGLGESEALLATGLVNAPGDTPR